MSLITRCPACETLFRVVPDQLRISEGWVRCGQCDEIFNASLHLLQGEPKDVAPDASPPDSVADSGVSCKSDFAALPLDIDLDTGPFGDDAELALVTQAVAANPWVSALEPIGPSPDDRVSWPTDDSAAAPEMSLSDHSRLDPWPPLQSEPAVQIPVPEASVAADDVSFLRGEKQNPVSRQPLMRVTLGLLSLLLLLALAGQVVLHERDRLVALQPGLKPWLLTLCGAFNCTLAPLRQIDAWVIESSAFSRLEGDSYRLNFSVRNTAVSALALPALELTMTDSFDQPVARRVLMPSELGATSDSLAGGKDWPVAVALSVKTLPTAGRVSGYRLLVFYP